MDNRELEKILSEDHAPEIDINARKRAVNLAVSEFKSAQAEMNKKENQKTFQGFSFLSRLIGIKTREGVRTMEKKRRSKFIYGGAATAMAVVLVGALSLSQLNDSISRYEQNVGVKPTAGQETVPSYVTEVEVSEIDEEVEDPLRRWRLLQEERINKRVNKHETKSSVAKHDFVGEINDNEVFSLDDFFSDSKSKKNKELNTPNESDKSVTSGLMKQKPAKDAVAPLGNWSRSEVGDSDLVEQQKPLYRWRQIQEEEMSSIATSQAPQRMDNKLKRRKMVASPSSANGLIVAEDMIAPYPTPMPSVYQEQNRDKFEQFTVNPFKQVSQEPVSTFSSDVDTASYSFVRKSLNNGRLPNPDAVRVEEMINYFDYNYPVPESRAEPFKPTVVVTDSPWAEGRKLMHIGIKGYQLEKTELRSNIVFLLDVSGSMNAPDKLPLVKSSMKMLLDSLHPDDTVSIVVYAGSTGVVLEPTKVSNRSTILNAMNNLRAGGGTAGAAGIRLAYDMAERNFDKRAVNRVIMATDGDFNVGITNRDELKSYVEKKRDKGIFLSVLGFGQGNYNDHMMQTLAQNGNGIAAYIDNLNEARKVLVQEATSSLFPIAKDVKFQVEFNPDAVAEYRLIGYETRALKREDFNNDKIDAGDMGAGHTVTAIYEFVPVGSKALSVDPLRYGKKNQVEKRIVKPVSNEYAYLKIRYKLPMESKSKLITMPVIAGNDYDFSYNLYEMVAGSALESIYYDSKFATAVAAFGQILKGEQYIGDFSYDDVIALAQQGKGDDKFGYRAEFINLVRLAKALSR